MNTGRKPPRNFLFLQGPPGPFFPLLGRELARRDCGVHRINLSGGDHYDWPVGAVNYRGRMRNWPLFFDGYVQDNAITDLVLYGDCRPVHQSVIRLARLRGLHIHVFEEGYIRPDWMTLERDGVNGHSRLDRDPDVLLAAASWLPEVPRLPTITAAFSRRARDSYWHYHHVVLGRWRFPFYRTHRPASIIGEGIGWLLRFARSGRRLRQAQAVLDALAGRKYFLFPLQLTGDYQIRAHSPFASMAVALDYVLRSFARHAPADTMLLVKEHPMDVGYTDWYAHVLREARRLGVADRVRHIDGGELSELCAASAGMVCVNSTSGTLALEVGIPVVVLGDAVYDVPGITHQGPLDAFWSSPEPAEPELYRSFKKVLHASCLVRGGLASASAIRILVTNSVERLLSEDPASARRLHAAAARQAAGASAQELGSRPSSSR